MVFLSPLAGGNARIIPRKALAFHVNLAARTVPDGWKPQRKVPHV
jgi:hypothetical protein